MTPPKSLLIPKPFSLGAFDLSKFGPRVVTPSGALRQRHADTKRARRRLANLHRVATGGMLSTKGYVYGPASLAPPYRPSGTPWKRAR